MKRSGIDPIRLDKRPLAEILDDCIPYARFERDLNLIQRMGHNSWLELLKDRNDKNTS